MMDNYKKKMFPEIEDFSDPMNEKRNKSPNDLDFGDFVWFSPFAAKIIIATFFFFWVTVFLTLTILSALKDSLFFAGLFLILTLFIIFKPAKEYIAQFFVFNTEKNLYDLFLREYNDTI